MSLDMIEKLIAECRAEAAAAEEKAGAAAAMDTSRKRAAGAGLEGGSAHGCATSPKDQVEQKRQKVAGRTPVLPGITVEMVQMNMNFEPTGIVYKLHVLGKLGKGGNGAAWRVRRVGGSSHTPADDNMGGGGIGSVAATAAGVSSSSNSGGTSGGCDAGIGGRGIGDGSQPGPAVAGAGAIKAPPPGRDLCLKTAIYYEDCRLQYKRKYSQADHEAATHTQMALEFELLDALRASPYVIDCYGYGRLSTDDGRQLYCVLLELADLGTLDNLVRPNGVPKGLTPEAAHGFMRSIMIGLSNVHNQANAIHRDIKSTNIVLTGEVTNPKAKIIDFGCAHFMGSYLDDLSSKWHVGTPVFAAPEQRKGYLHDVRIDSYHLGLTFVQMRFGEAVPFPHLWRQYTSEKVALSKEELEEQEQRRQDLVAELGRADCPYTNGWSDGRVRLTPVELDFSKKCLEPDARRRDTVMRLLRHDYVDDGPFATL